MTHHPTAAIIVAHGQPSEPGPPEATLAEFASHVAQTLPGWQVTSATLANPGALDAALADSPENPLIYPMFMSQGWFTQTHLINRLGDHAARVALPFGVDPGLPDMADALLRGVLAEQGWRAEDTQLFLAGHGSGRSPNAARDTYAFAEALADRIQFSEQRVGFVEQPPHLEDAAAGLSAQSICLPFFAAKLGHVIDDIPEALNSTGFAGIRLDPVGCAPMAPALVSAALLRANQDQSAVQTSPHLLKD